MNKPLKNVAASVRQKLANLGKESNRPFAELLQYSGWSASSIGSADPSIAEQDFAMNWEAPGPWHE